MILDYSIMPMDAQVSPTVFPLLRREVDKFSNS